MCGADNYWPLPCYRMCDYLSSIVDRVNSTAYRAQVLDTKQKLTVDC